MKQRNPPSSLFEEGEHAALVELRREPRGSSHVGTGISGNLLSCRKGVRYPFMFQRERGIPLETLLWKGASSGSEEIISWFFSCCCRKLGVPLDLQRGPQGPARFASKNSGLLLRFERDIRIALESMPEKRAVSRVQSVNSAFLSSGDRDLRFPLKVQQGSQASCGVGAWNSAFLSSCQRGGRPPVEFRRGIRVFSRGSAGVSSFPACCEGILCVALELVHRNQDLCRVEGQLSVLSPCSRSRGAPIEIQYVIQATPCGARGSWDSS